VVGKDGLAELRHVNLAEWQAEAWIVESGLAPGDQLIVDRLMQLRAGVPVVAAKLEAGP
jgi:multidrug efflux pump subunit AcrA (membrane-fusion protein)